MNLLYTINGGIYSKQARCNVINIQRMREDGYDVEFIWIPSKMNKDAKKLAYENFKFRAP